MFVRDYIKKIVLGLALLISSTVFADDYKVLIIPDNIVTDNIAVDSFIYNASAEFFADDIINLLNSTDYIKAPTISETRYLYKQDPNSTILAKNLMNKFKTNYNVDYISLKKLANKSNTKYALLMTSYIDAENYILRRTPWDVLNIPGASVIDPAYKISTYAVLIDTEKNTKLWSDTFYKTISVYENRIITRGASPQVEQLQKIKDYSHYLSPQIAQNIQLNILSPEVLAQESTKIDYNIGNIDNIFTKKYRHLGKESNKIYKQQKENVKDIANTTKEKIEDVSKTVKQVYNEKIQPKLNSKKEVKAIPIINTDENINNINNKKSTESKFIKKAIFKKNNNDIQYSDLIEIEIKKKKRKNNLYGDFQLNQPELRSYN